MKVSTIGALALTMTMLMGGVAAAVGDAARAVLVVNGASWASTRLANEYAALRGIPAGNIVTLTGISSFDRMPVAVFRREILGPVMAAIEARGLRDQVDTVLYSADFPPTIDISGDLKGTELPAMLAPQCSINSLTFFAADVMACDTGYLDLGGNPYARKFPRAARDTKWSADERHRLARALKLIQKPSPGDATSSQYLQNVQAAGDILEELWKLHPNSDVLLYNIACARALQGNGEAAVGALRQAMDAGWSDASTTAGDEDLKSLRERPDFKALVAELKALKIEVDPSSPFGRTYDGHDYRLSTMLAYTSGRGNSVEEALSYMRAAAAADGTRPAGTVFYLRNGDVRSTTREWAFAAACERLKALGVGAEIQEGVLPQKQPAVAGAMIGTAGFSWKDCASTILPGAICEHLTSCGGMLGEYDGQTPLTEFLRFGAAGAAGTVTEPYALQGKFPNPFIHWFYAQGCNLAEAFYQSVTGPYQLLIVGDPLCRPWARRIAIEVTKPAAGATVKGKCGLTLRTLGETATAARTLDILLDGKRVAVLARGARRYTLDTHPYADGWHELTVAVSPTNAVPLCGSVSVPLWFANAVKPRLQVAPVPAKLAWDQPLVINAALPGAEAVVLRHNGCEIARAEGSNGAMTVDSRLLGQGPVALMPVAMIRGKDGAVREVGGEPVRLEVVPPDPLAAMELPPGKTLADGLLLTVAGQPPRVLAKLDNQPFGPSAPNAATNSFSLEGWFCAESTAVHQFQAGGTAHVQVLKVDGKVCEWPRGAGWWFMPVHLQQGWHKVLIEGNATPGATLDIRFGGTGTQRLAAPRFNHLPPSEQGPVP